MMSNNLSLEKCIVCPQGGDISIHSGTPNNFTLAEMLSDVVKVQVINLHNSIIPDFVLIKILCAVVTR